MFCTTRFFVWRVIYPYLRWLHTIIVIVALFTVGRTLSKLIMDIAMSGTNVDQWENIKQCYVMT